MKTREEKAAEWRPDQIKKRSRAEKNLDQVLRSWCEAHGWDLKIQYPAFPEDSSRFYFFDFFIEELGLVIEVDGPHHEESEQLAKDIEQDTWSESVGYTTIRIKSDDIHKDIRSVVKRVRVVAQIDDSPDVYDKFCPVIRETCYREECSWFTTSGPWSDCEGACALSEDGLLGRIRFELILIREENKPKSNQ